jgi:hypothetical protein
MVIGFESAGHIIPLGLVLIHKHGVCALPLKKNFRLINGLCLRLVLTDSGTQEEAMESKPCNDLFC